MAAQTRKPYLTDRTDAQWAVLQPLMPRAKPGGRPRQVDMRAVLNTLLSLNRTGCQWDLLPHDLLPKRTVSAYFAQWRNDGTWQRLLDALRAAVRQPQAPAHEPPPVLPASTAKRCRRRHRVASGAMRAARKSRAAHAISASMSWDCCWWSSSAVPLSTMPSPLRRCSSTWGWHVSALGSDLGR